MRKRILILGSLVIVIGLYALFAALWDRSDPKAAMLHDVSANYRLVWKILGSYYPEGQTVDIPDGTLIGYEVSMQKWDPYLRDWVNVNPEDTPYSVAHAFLDGATSNDLFFILNSRYPGGLGELGQVRIEQGNSEKLYAMAFFPETEEYVVGFINID